MIGFGWILLQRGNELSASVLSHTCEVVGKNSKKTKKVSNFFLHHVTIAKDNSIREAVIYVLAEFVR